DSSIGPDRRVSRPSTNGRSEPRTRTAARPSAVTSSGVSSRFATPRMPSVPKRRVIVVARGAALLPLRVLRRLARLLEAVLAAFLLARVAREQPRLLERGPQLVVEPHERPGDAEAQRAGLAADPTTGDRRVDVVDVGGLSDAQRLRR